MEYQITSRCQPRDKWCPFESQIARCLWSYWPLIRPTEDPRLARGQKVAGLKEAAFQSNFLSNYYASNELLKNMPRKMKRI